MYRGGGGVGGGIPKRKEILCIRTSGHFFFPVAIETMGVWGPGASDLIRDLGGRFAVQLGDPQAATHFKQKLDVAVLRGNAISVMGNQDGIFSPKTPPKKPKKKQSIHKGFFYEKKISCPMQTFQEL